MQMKHRCAAGCLSKQNRPGGMLFAGYRWPQLGLEPLASISAR